MKKHYHGRLSADITMPQKANIRDAFKSFVEFPIYCPKCGSKNYHLKKNGHDKKHQLQPQFFYCHKCRKSFYPHTSGVFEELRQIEWDNIITDLVYNRFSPTMIAKVHHSSPYFISAVIHRWHGQVVQRLAELKHEQESWRQKQMTLNILQADVYWWDELFLKVSGEQWCLLWIIDSLGPPCAWKLSQTRSQIDYLELLKQIEASLPSVPIFIGDAWNAYATACCELKHECYSIEHVHSHPWQDVRIHEFRNNQCTAQITQNTIIIPYDSFVMKQSVQGVSHSQSYPIHADKQCTKKRGRPKGKKNSKK